MSLSIPLWMVGAGVVLLGFAGRSLYERYLHPAWRKQRSVVRACERAFDEGDYWLVQLRIDPGDPSVTDLFPRPLGLPDVPRYFTYSIEIPEEVEPNFSGMSRSEIGLVRRYLDRSLEGLPHHGRNVLRPERKAESSLGTMDPEKVELKEVE